MNSGSIRLRSVDTIASNNVVEVKDEKNIKILKLIEKSENKLIFLKKNKRKRTNVLQITEKIVKYKRKKVKN